jgi:hypothetical protein
MFAMTIHKLTIKSHYMKSGTVNQVAAFEKLVGICNDLGARYNPSKAALMPTALATLHEQAQQSLEAVNVARVNYLLAINARQDRFAGVYPMAARIVRALSASESSKGNIRDAKMLKRKLAARSKPTGIIIAAIVADGSPAPVSGTISRLDYGSLADTFASLVQLIQSLSLYAPNESDLQVASLRTMVADLRMASLTVANASNALTNARMHRNKVLFGEDGMLETGTAVKDYIRSVFGVSSEPAKQIGKLRLAA